MITKTSIKVFEGIFLFLTMLSLPMMVGVWSLLSIASGFISKLALQNLKSLMIVVSILLVISLLVGWCDIYLMKRRMRR